MSMLHFAPSMSMPCAMPRPLFVFAIFPMRSRSRFTVIHRLFSKLGRNTFDLEAERPFHLEDFAALVPCNQRARHAFFIRVPIHA